MTFASTNLPYFAFVYVFSKSTLPVDVAYIWDSQGFHYLSLTVPLKSTFYKILIFEPRATI